MFLAKIGIVGGIGGVLIVLLTACILTGLVTAILDAIRRYLVKDNRVMIRVIYTITSLLWLATLILVVLEILNITTYYTDFLALIFKK